MSYLAVDKNDAVRIDERGKLVNAGMRKIDPYTDKDGHLRFRVPDPSGVVDERYVAVEVLRHHGPAEAAGTRPKKLGIGRVAFKDGDKKNVSVTNLELRAERGGQSAEGMAQSAERGEQSAERGEQSAERGAQGAESKGQSVEHGSGAEVDDLTSIKGVGAKFAERLNDMGITTYADLANADAKKLAEELNVTGKQIKKIQEQC